MQRPQPVAMGKFICRGQRHSHKEEEKGTEDQAQAETKAILLKSFKPTVWGPYPCSDPSLELEFTVRQRLSPNDAAASAL